MKRLLSILFVIVIPIFCMVGNIMQIEVTTQEVVLQQYVGCEMVQEISTIERIVNYEPTEEERLFAYKVAYAEAGLEDELGKILVINTAINNMRERGFENLIQEFTARGRYSTVINGEVYLIYRNKQGDRIEKLITDDMISQEIKDAVEEAFLKDYSEELLKQEAERLGITDSKYYEGGTLYFCNPKAISSEKANNRKYIKVLLIHGNHVFYRYWNKSEDDL